MPEHHKVRVIRISEVLPHPNADRLEIIRIPNTEYQVIVDQNEFHTGDLAVYLTPDSVVPEKSKYSFLWEPRRGTERQFLRRGNK